MKRMKVKREHYSPYLFNVRRLRVLIDHFEGGQSECLDKQVLINVCLGSRHCRRFGYLIVVELGTILQCEVNVLGNRTEHTAPLLNLVLWQLLIGQFGLLVKVR